MSQVQVENIEDGDTGNHAGFVITAPPEYWNALVHDKKVWPSGWQARGLKSYHLAPNQKNKAEYNMAPTTVKLLTKRLGDCDYWLDCICKRSPTKKDLMDFIKTKVKKKRSAII